MTKQTLNGIIAATLLALDSAKSDPLLGGIPNGHLYAQLMDRLDLDAWLKIVTALKDAGLVTERGHFIKITPHGSEVAAKIAATLAKAKAETEGVGL